MSWFIGYSTTMSFCCDREGCNADIDESDEGTLTDEMMRDGLKNMAILDGWCFVDEDGDECYCPEHAKGHQS